MNRAKPGRPAITRSQELADTIFDRLANGESLAKICSDDAMPSTSTIFRWLADDDEFCDQYARAREAQADRYAEETIEIADRPSETELALQDKREMIEARKWFAGKLKGQYSDRKGPETAVQVNIQQNADQYFEGM